MNKNALSSIKGVVGSNGKKMPNTPNPKEIIPNKTRKALSKLPLTLFTLFNSKELSFYNAGQR